eukprot:XP_001702897.1 predicted protein [Chlamydomonas reinhardtii]
MALEAYGRPLGAASALGKLVFPAPPPSVDVAQAPASPAMRRRSSAIPAGSAAVGALRRPTGAAAQAAASPHPAAPQALARDWAFKMRAAGGGGALFPAPPPSVDVAQGSASSAMRRRPHGPSERQYGSAGGPAWLHWRGRRREGGMGQADCPQQLCAVACSRGQEAGQWEVEWQVRLQAMQLAVREAKAVAEHGWLESVVSVPGFVV